MVPKWTEKLGGKVPDWLYKDPSKQQPDEGTRDSWGYPDPAQLPAGGQGSSQARAEIEVSTIAPIAPTTWLGKRVCAPLDKADRWIGAALPEANGPMVGFGGARGAIQSDLALEPPHPGSDTLK